MSLTWIDDVLNRYETPLLYAALVRLPPANIWFRMYFAPYADNRKRQDHIAEWLFTTLRHRAIDRIVRSNV